MHGFLDCLAKKTNAITGHPVYGQMLHLKVIIDYSAEPRISLSPSRAPYNPSILPLFLILILGSRISVVVRCARVSIVNCPLPTIRERVGYRMNPECGTSWDSLPLRLVC